MSLGEKYNVNPLIFSSIYAIPFFFASVTWIVKNIKTKSLFFCPSCWRLSFLFQLISICLSLEETFLHGCIIFSSL